MKAIAVGVLLACLLPGARLQAQEPSPPPVEDTSVAGGSSADPPARRLVKWNEYEGPLFTLRASAGVILDAGTYCRMRPAESSSTSSRTRRCATSA